MKHNLTVLVTALMLMTGSVAAGELVDAAQKAEDLQAQGQHLEAIDALAAATAKLWDQSPLLVRQAFFVDGEPGGFGIYNLHEGVQFKRTEPLVIYAEPVGYGYRKENGLKVIALTMDFAVKSKSGETLAEQKSFGNLTLSSHVANREFFAKITYDFAGLTPGDYEVVTTLNDQPSGKTVAFSLPFTMTE